MAYEQEYLRKKTLENFGNLWYAVNLHPKKGGPFDTGNVLGYILSSRGHRNKDFRVAGDAGYIDSLAVLPEARGQGLAIRLRELAFEHWLDFYKFETVHTLARPDNEPMCSLNRRMKLVATRALESGLYPDGQPRTEYVLTRHAWQEYKQENPDRDWDSDTSLRDISSRFDFKAVRRKFSP